MRSVWTVFALIWLTACSTEDDREPAATPEMEAESQTAEPAENQASGSADSEPLDEAALRALVRDREALREAMADPARRQAIREQMQALREQRRAERDVDPEARRAAMAERGERFRNGRQPPGGDGRVARGRSGARFWEDESMVESLGLSESQVSNLATAHEQLVSSGRAARQSLARVTSSLQEALSSADRQQLQSLVETRREALASRAGAEAEWTQTVLSTLSDEQLRQLAEDHPALIRRLAAPN